MGINNFVITTSYKGKFFKRYLKQHKSKSSKFKIVNENGNIKNYGAIELDYPCWWANSVLF